MSPKFVALMIIGILLFIGILILLSGIMRYRKSRTFLRTEGVILVKKGFRLDYGKPNVRYRVNDYTYTYTSTIGQKLPLRHGKKVDVLYHPEDPAQAIIDTFVQRGGKRIIAGSFIVIFCIFSIPFIMILIKMDQLIPK